MSWNAWGRASSSTPIASPSRTTARTGSARAHLDDTGQPAGDVVEVPGVDPHVVVDAVHLDARAVELPLHRRHADVGQRRRRRPARPPRASGGRLGRPRARHRCSPVSPSVSATTATRPRLPDSIAARRTSGAGTDAARATASAMRPPSAPWRSSPTSSRRRKSTSAARRPIEHVVEDLLAAGDRAAARGHLDSIERSVDVGDRQRRHRRRRDVEPEHGGPAHARRGPGGPRR